LHKDKGIVARKNFFHLSRKHFLGIRNRLCKERQVKEIADQGNLFSLIHFRLAENMTTLKKRQKFRANG